MSRKLKILLFTLYLFSLCFLMWFPSQKTGIKIDWYFLGIRGDHLIHSILFTPYLYFCSILYNRKNFIIHYLIGISLAALLESSQYFLPYRTFSFADFLANFCGLTFSIIFYFKPTKINK